MRPIPTIEKVAESEPLLQPLNTNYTVLMNSAARRLAMGHLLHFLPLQYVGSDYRRLVRYNYY